MANLQLTLLVLAVAMGCFTMAPVSGFIHIVGGGHGWSVPDNKTFYKDWARPRTFGVGDRLGMCNASLPHLLFIAFIDFFAPSGNLSMVFATFYKRVLFYMVIGLYGGHGTIC